MGFLLGLLFVFSSQPSAASELSSLSAKENQACVIYEGAVRCWGRNWVKNIPTSLALGARSVQVGAHHACALNSSVQVECWAENGYEVLANVPPDLLNVRSLTVGDLHTCAENDSKIQCWGNLNFQTKRTANFVSMVSGNGFVCLQFGNNTECHGEAGLTPRLPVGIFTKRIFPMADMYTYQNVSGVCLVDQSNQLHCYNGYFSDAVGQEYDGSVRAYARGYDYECYVKNQRLNCREFGMYGPDGLSNERLISRIPEDIKLSTDVMSFVLGDRFACVQLSNRVRCWGKNLEGQASPPLDLIQARYASVSPWADICAIGSLGDLNCYLNTKGIKRSIQWPNQIANISDLKAVEFSSIAEDFTCAVGGPENKLTCWYDDYLSRPMLAFGSPGNFKKLMVGHLTCMLVDSRLACEEKNSNIFKKLEAMDGLENVADMGSSYVDLCVVKTDKSLKCVHTRNSFNYEENLKVENLVMKSHTACAITADQTVKCWGDKTAGALDVPAGLSNISRVIIDDFDSSQNDVACAFSKDGKKVCWSIYPKDGE
jgi:hypothetical protein